MSGCNIIGSSKYPVKRFVDHLEATGEELCDTCPYADCIASQTQSVSLWHAQEKYRREHRPAPDQHYIARQEALRAMWRNEKKRQRNNPTGRKQGRPRKEEQSGTSS